MPQKRACSRVIYVSYGTGCYRHLRIPSSYTLEELAEAILEAFDFINDHAHAFFMDDRCWSEADAYWMDSGMTIGNGRKRKKSALPANTHWMS